MPNVQIFGTKDSQTTRAAQRFFKERGVQFQFVDLKQKAMAPAEIKRFVERFGLPSLLDPASKAYVDGGFQYLKLTPAETLAKIERNPDCSVCLWSAPESSSASARTKRPGKRCLTPEPAPTRPRRQKFRAGKFQFFCFRSSSFHRLKRTTPQLQIVAD